jgi:hypothetical protein
MQECAINFISLSFPHSCPHSSHSIQPKDTLLRFLVQTLTNVYNMDLRHCNRSSPSQMHLDFYMPLFLQLGPLLSPSFLNINPSLEQHIYFAKSLAQQNSTMTSLVVQTANKKKNSYQKNFPLAPSFCLLSYLPLSITQTSFQCSSSFHHHLSL